MTKGSAEPHHNIFVFMKIRYLLLHAILGLSTAVSAKDVVWYTGGHVTYSTQKNYGTVVAKALDMFSADMKAVTGKSARKGEGKIEIYQLDMLNNKEFKRLSGYKIPLEKFIAKPDAFWMGIRNGKVVIVGSNGRGTAYGILELSCKAGVSPWIDWGDVTPQRKHYLVLNEQFETLQHPSVEYRGVFINDEDWSTRVWDKQLVDAHSKSGILGPRYYHRLFELLLRLRANTLWPAMHEGTDGFFQVKGNKEVADSFDIVLGSSHCEPILRNNVAEWNSKQRGPYNWITNRKQVENYWRERAQETAHMDGLYTLGMRGIHDGSMEGVGGNVNRVKALQSVIDEQRNILHQTVNRNLKKVPQVFIPYKEVLQIYESGLKVPDEVMLMWCDDNYGYQTRLPDAAEQKRAGGSGVYYHLSYWGRPHDYLWLTTTQPGLVYSEMREAWDHNARRLWIANVHDPKVAAYDLSLFMDMAWNINSVTASSLQQHLRDWLTQQFGEEAAAPLTEAMTEFYHLCGIRRPEFMGWNQVELDRNRYKNGWSPVQDTEFSADEFGNELERYLNDYEAVKHKIAAAEQMIRPELKDAFFAAIKYPVYCAAAMATKQLQAQEARHITRKENFHRDEEALEAAVRSMKAYQEIQTLTEYYNKQMAHGKWNGLMDMAPLGNRRRFAPRNHPVPSSLRAVPAHTCASLRRSPCQEARALGTLTDRGEPCPSAVDLSFLRQGWRRCTLHRADSHAVERQGRHTLFHQHRRWRPRDLFTQGALSLRALESECATRTGFANHRHQTERWLSHIGYQSPRQPHRRRPMDDRLPSRPPFLRIPHQTGLITHRPLHYRLRVATLSSITFYNATLSL